MTRKHFEALANELKDARKVLLDSSLGDCDSASLLVGFNAALEAVIATCEQQNVRFDREKFWDVVVWGKG